LHDKMAALDKMGKHLGMFTDKTELEIKSIPQIIIKRGGNNE
jgi:hypothetical protein